jgi:glycosyltransferase involved in cell wall biosynthesis
MGFEHVVSLRACPCIYKEAIMLGSLYIFARPIAMSKRIAVITPYYKEPVQMLKDCHASVVSQGVDVDHFMVADGFPLDEVSNWPVQHVLLNKAHADNGNTPRGIGAFLAINQGYDFVTFLDADNWYHPGHLQSMLDLYASTKADVCCSRRTYHDMAGHPLPVTEEVEDKGRHIDTSCMFFAPSAFDAMGCWLKMPKQLSPICDRVMLNQLWDKRYKLAFSELRSVAFRSQYAWHYRDVKAPPTDIKLKGQDEFDRCIKWLYSAEGVSACVSNLGFWPNKIYL